MFFLLFRLLKLAVKLLMAVVIVAVGYFGVTLVQVWLTSRHYEPRSAGAIIVMGSAQYNGSPSPDLKARLNEALILYHHGYSSLIAVTGSKQPGDRYTEAGTEKRYLQAAGVPSASIIEGGGTDSYANVADVAPELRSHKVVDVLMVTDPFHEDESMAIASSLGFHPFPAPTQTSPITGTATIPYFLKEAVAVGLGRIIGYSHLGLLGVPYAKSVSRI